MRKVEIVMADPLDVPDVGSDFVSIVEVISAEIFSVALVAIPWSVMILCVMYGVGFLRRALFTR